MNAIYEKNLGNDSVEWLHGRAHLLSKNEAEIVLDDSTKVKIRAKKILLATGGHPNIPKTPGSEYGITSDGFFDLEKRPEKVALVGAGYIAVEMAGMFHHLGSETHLFIRHEKFLRNFDPMIQDKIMSEYERQYVLSTFREGFLFSHLNQTLDDLTCLENSVHKICPYGRSNE